MSGRSEETKNKYLAEQLRFDDFNATRQYDNKWDHVVTTYEHWYILTNLFPYDNLAQAHDLLVPKRIFGKMSDCDKEEWEEYKTILNQLESDGHYDAILENFSKSRSILKHLHLHLIIWKED
jgi:diadenosine tetraphosphate (Ap4A) HIT family hydrolase